MQLDLSRLSFRFACAVSLPFAIALWRSRIARNPGKPTGKGTNAPTEAIEVWKHGFWTYTKRMECVGDVTLILFSYYIPYQVWIFERFLDSFPFNRSWMDCKTADLIYTATKPKRWRNGNRQLGELVNCNVSFVVLVSHSSILGECANMHLVYCDIIPTN